MSESLSRLEAGMPIVYGGDRVARVSQELAESFKTGDQLIVVQDSGDLLHVPREAHLVATEAVASARSAFQRFGLVSDERVTAFYERFAELLADDDVFAEISQANQADVDAARERGRSVTRLVLSDRMRQDMIDGLLLWSKTEAGRGSVDETTLHDGWRLDQVRSGLGVVAFIFEGRPNVLADATGVLRSGNTVVFRIGSDALGTARSIMSLALEPAMTQAGLPEGSVVLIDSTSRAAGWAMFSNPGVSLAVARGSGAAVSQLGAVARQAGIPVSLHGTGGTWIVAADSADPEVLHSAVYHSLDRKVCNTLNTFCVVDSRAAELVPVFLQALQESAERRGAAPKLHATTSALPFVPGPWLSDATITRAEGPVLEPMTEEIADTDLGIEWEWEESPEVTLTIVADVAEAVRLFNDQSPKFGASLISADESEHDTFFETIDAPFVGNGFTRWVDGQYALDKPELGLSNWQFGRLFGRSGILSGDSVFTLRGRVTQDDPGIGR